MTERVYCPEPHHHGPDGIHAFLVWAADMERTHTQHQCLDCGGWVIWRPKTTAPAVEPAQLGLNTEET